MASTYGGIPRVLACAALLAASTLSAANPPAADRGLAWLTQQTQANGSVNGEAASIATPYQARAETLTTFKAYTSVPGALGNAVTAEPDTGTEHTARKLMALAALGSGAFAQVTALTALQNADGGFGGAAGYQSNPLDSAYALISLNAAGSTSSTAASNAVNYLIAVQATDGSFAIDGQSSVYVTAYALQAMNAVATSYPLTTQAQLARSWLAAAQATGAYPTVLEDAVAAIAMVGNSTDPTALAGVQAAIQNSQSADGSWSSDPYVTAIAIRAVVAMGNLTFPPPAPSGALQGTVRDGVTGAVLAGATVSAGGVSIQTDAAGNYRLTGIAAGSATVAVTLTGYPSIAVPATFTNGATLYFSPSLYPAGATIGRTSAALTVVAATSQQAIAGASVSAGAASAATDAGGRATLTGLAQGMTTLQIAAAGYLSGSVTVLLAPGANAGPTVALAAAGQSLTLSGTITDSATASAIGGALVRVTNTTLSATTNSSGQYQVAGITTTQFGVSVSAAGYASKTVNVTLTQLADAHLDVALVKTQSGGLVMTGTTTGAPTYPPYSQIGVLTDVQNTTATAQTLSFSATLLDAGGLPVLQTVGHAFTLAPNATTHVDIDLHNTTQPAGTYSVLVQGFDANGNVVLEGSASLAIMALARISGSVVLTPPVAQAGATQPISIAPTVSNHGNVVIPAGQVELTITLDAADASYAPLGQATSGPPIVSNGFLNRPVGGVYDAQGILWILNGNDGKIVRVAPNANGTYTSSVWFDPSTVSPNPFPSPVALTIDTAGNLYVLNPQNTIYKVDSAKNLTKITTNQFSQKAIASNGGQLLYVSVEGYTSSVISVDVSSQAVTTVVGSGFSQPAGIAVASDGTAYVSGAGSIIVKMSPNGAITTFLSSGLSGPKGLAITGAGDLLIADSGTNRILTASTTSAPTLPLSVYASGMNLSSPGPITLAPDGTLFVGNSGNNSIAVVPPGGGPAQLFARSLLTSATGMAYDAAGNLYGVGSTGDVVKFDPAGVITALNRLPGATSVAPGPFGTIVVASGNGTLVPYPSNGSDIVTGLNTPSGLAFAGGTSMYVAERFGNRVSLVNMATKAITPFATSFVNSGDDAYFAPNGDRYILNNNRIDRVGATSGATLPSSGLAFSAQAFVPNPAGGFYLEEGSSLKSMNASGVVTTISTSVTLSTLAIGMALDNAGNLLIGDRFARKILQVNPASGAVATFADLSGLSTSSLWSVASDGSGGVFVGVSDGKIVRVASSGNASLLTALSFGTPRRLAFDAGNAIVYVKTDFDVESFAIAMPNQITSLPIPGSSGGTLQFANGQVQVINDRAELRTYTPQGVLVSTLAGFNQPSALVFDGTRVIVADSSKTISIVAGQLPQTLADETVVALTFSQGALYGSRGTAIFSLPAGSRTYASYYAPTNIGLGLVTAIAARGDGGFSFASQGDERVLTIDASKQIVASYAGVNSPSGIAADASGGVYVATGFRQIIRIDRNTGQSLVYDPFTTSTVLAFYNGQLHATAGGRLTRYSASGAPSVVFSDPNGGYSALYGTSTGLYIADGAQLKISRWDGSAMTALASGLAGVDALAVGTDGTLYTGGKYGSVTRASGQSIVQLSGDLGNVTALGVGPSGRIYAGSALGNIVAFDPVTFKRSDLTSVAQIANAATNRSPAVQYLAVDRSEALAAGVGNSPTEVYRITYTPPPAPPASGTVMYSTRVSVPDLPVGAVQPIAGIPSWPVPFPGDFKFSIHRVDAVTGEGVNELHVGPAATGSLAVGASQVPPGNSSVHVTARLQGADFSSVARADTSRAALVMQGSSARVMGADALGRIYFGSGTTVFRTKASGGSEIIWTSPGGGGLVVGSIPVDNNQNFYSVGGAGNTEIFGVSSVTLQQMSHNTLTEPIISIVRDSQDTLWALTQTFDATTGTGFYVGKLWHVVPGGAATLLNTGVFRGPFSLAIDGKDNLYVHTNGSGIQSAIFRVTRDGATSVTIVADPAGDPSFEYEGVNMTGDCADNILVTPLSWKKYGQGAGWAFPQFEEEHTVIQVNGTTGKIAQIFDGVQFNTDLSDMDALVYDRFGGQLLIMSERWVTTGQAVVYRIPLTCGSINTDFHVVMPPGQSASGYSVAPNSIVARGDGSNELVWSLNALQNSGQSLSFDTALANLGLGETRAIASEAFLLFQDTFVANQVKVPLAVPTVTADGLVDVAVAANPSSYPSNTPISSTVTVTSRDASQARTANLVITITDAQNALVAQVAQQQVTVPAGGSVAVPVMFNTGIYLSGSYLVKAQLLDPATGIGLSSASASFDILADAASILTSISSDKASYQPFDTVTLDARGKNVSLNSISGELTLTVVVRDPSGNTVFSGSRTLSALVPGALQDTFFRFPLSAAPSGQYTAELSATPAGVPPIPVRTTTFNVLSTVDTGSGVQGSLSVPGVANSGDTVSIVAVIADHGNAALANVPVTFRVINPANGTTIFTQSTTANVPQGGEQPISQSWNTTGTAAGTYIVSASGTFSGRDIALGQANIRIGAIQAFAFAPVANAPLNSLVVSGSVTVAGILAPAPISIAGGEFQVGNGAWSGSTGTVLPGDVVTVRVTTLGTFNATTTATLTIAGFSAPFAVTTVNPRTTPDAFSFTPLTNVPLGSVQASNTITVTGIDTQVPISIAGGEYSINGAAFTSAPGTVRNGDTITVRLTASGSLGTTSTATLTISTVTGTFSVTTTAVKSVPDAFSFTAQNNVARNTVATSNTVTITGINIAVPVSVAGGTYSINGGAFTSAAGTISNGNTVAVRQTSAADFSKTTTVVLTVSSVTGSFAVTTEGADTSPDPFSFTAQTGVALNTPITSNSVTIRGINTSVPVSVAGGTYSVNAGAYTSASGTLNPLDTVTARQTSSSSFATTTTATLTVGDASAPFAVTTKSVADVHATSALSADERLLVLIACKTNDDGEDDAGCDQTRVTFLDSYLTALGVSHQIVTTDDAFKSEFRSGRYDAYWISGGAKKLEDEVASELVEAGFRGETLVIDGVHDSRNKVLDDVVGVLYKGKPSHLDTVTLTGTFLPAGTFTPSGAKPVRVDLSTGVGQAKFNTGDPAIVTNMFGLGRGLLFAFDLVGTLSAQPTSTLLQAVLGQSLDYVAPTVLATFTGGAYVPFSLDLKNNEAVTVTMDVTLTLPAGFLLVSTTPAASQSGTTVTWHVTAQPGATVSLDGVVRTPDASGTYSLPIVVTQTYGSTSVQVGSFPIAIVVKGLDMALPQVIAALQALSVPTAHGDRSARDDAVSSLQSAQTYINQARWEDAISKLAEAADDLDSISSVDVSSYRVSVDNVMKEVEWRWWASLPVCPSGSPCRTP